MKCKCVTECYFQDRLWHPGDVLEYSKSTEAPRHFVSTEKYKAPKMKDVLVEKKEAAKAVGHLEVTDDFLG